MTQPPPERPEYPQDADEATMLLGLLQFHRDTLRRKTAGLDAGQLDTTLPPSDLTLGGMLRHMSYVEDWWFGQVLAGLEPAAPFDDVDWEADGDWDWHSASGLDPVALREEFDRFTARSDELDRGGARSRRTGGAAEPADRGRHQPAVAAAAHDPGVRAPQRARRPDPAVRRRRGRRVTIREMTAADWPQVWEFFAEIVAAGETYAYPEDLSSEQARELWTMRPPGRTVVWEGPDGVLGSATMGPNRPGRGRHVGTASFMVSPRARGRGVGRALAEHVVAWHRAQGYRAIQFNAVVETNTGAVRLWQSLGFEIVGTVPEAFESRAHGLVGLHVMHLALAETG